MNFIKKNFFVPFFIFVLQILSVSCSSNLFDYGLYESVIDDDLCAAQMTGLSTNTAVALRFIDAWGKIPSGILEGNIISLGNYYQCLNIKEVIDDFTYEGKYCSISVKIPISLADTTEEGIKNAELIRSDIKRIIGPITGQIENDMIRDTNGSLYSIPFVLGICLPKVCSTKQAMEFIQDIISIDGIEIKESFCRLPNDKPFMAADYVAFVIFPVIMLLVFCSTVFELTNIFYLEKDPKNVNPYIKSLSLYTNSKRLFTFNKIPGSIECLDGIRAISMFWVMVGHTFATTAIGPLQNPIVTGEFVRRFWSLYIMSAPYAVDTFYLMSGLLLVYTIISNRRRGAFVKSLHLYLLNRYVRTFAVLAAVVLLQASLFHHFADGPYWNNYALLVENCRENWWATLLHVQNYVFTIDEMCLVHTWYLAVDTQLYVFAPVVIVLLYGSKVISILATVSVILISLVISSVYSFTYSFSAALGGDSDLSQYFKLYYANTLTRSPPFFIGMLFGYILFIFKNTRTIHKELASLMWISSIGLMFIPFISTYFIMQPDFDNQLINDLLNSYSRAMWAAGLGLVVFCCTQGYGGPINWFLSLDFWKFPARLSYAMYLVHYPLQLIYVHTCTSSYYFTEADIIFRNFAFIVSTVIVATFLTLLLDSPLMTIQKLLLQGPRPTRISSIAKSDETTTAEEKDNKIKDENRA